MNVEQAMTKDVRVCGRSSSLNEAARIMWERDCGFVPVVEDDGSGRLVGVLTDRDLCMAVYTQGKRLSEIRAGEVMTRAVRSCHPGDSLEAVEGTMAAAQVRRLPVVDVSDHVVGVISLSDLARQVARAGRGARAAQSDIGETLGAISRPRQIAAPAPAGA
jgi:CBS domain-containing protein